MNKKAPQARKGEALVSLTDDHVILCVLSGQIDELVVRRSLDETASFVQMLRAQDRPVSLLIDATGVTSQTSEARSLAKRLGTMGIAKLAIVNRRVALGLIIQYLIRASGVTKQAQVFRTRTKALTWLRQGRVDTAPTYGLARASIALFVAGTAVAALIGWGLGTPLKSWFPDIKAMNPVVAIVLVAQAILVLCIRRGKLSRRRRRIVAAIALASSLFGAGVLVNLFLGVHLHVDDWLFHDQLGVGVFSGLASPRAGFLLVLLGIMELALAAGQRRAWQTYVFHTASVVVFSVTILSVIGYAYGLDYLYEAGGLIPIPLNTAVCVLLLCYALQTVVTPSPLFARLWGVYSKYNYTAIICAIIILFTGIMWHQSRTDQQNNRTRAANDQLRSVVDTFNDRMNGYTDTLRGYQSFFRSSDFVSAKEFSEFFASSELHRYHPGFSAISFARAIPTEKRAAFESSMRQQADTAFPAYARYTVSPATNHEMLYPTVYVQPHTATIAYGFDLGSDETRRLALERARDNGEATATDTIDLNAARGDKSLPRRPGFFITVPIYQNSSLEAPKSTAARRADLYGFVNTVLEYKVLFDDIFKDIRQSGIKFVVTSAANESVYTYTKDARDLPAEPTASDTIKVGGQIWHIALYAPKQFGVEGLGRYTPTLILSGGLMVLVLAAALTVGQTRRREQAMALAAAMTEDLNNERDTAVVLRQKDEAILSSIGDAVFAIDTKRRIILYNRAAAILVGRTEQEVLGKPYEAVLRFVDEKDRHVAHRFINAALEGKHSVMPQGTLLQRNDGSTVPVADSAAPIVNAKGRVEGVVVVFRDVTREKELDRLKNEFVSMASHELRTPMGAIRALSSMILAGDYGHVGKNLTEPLTDIHQATLRLVDLVNDLLSVARIEAGRMKFILVDGDVGRPIEQTVSSLRPLAREKGIELVSSAEKLPSVQFDPDKVSQVLTNLIGNALKFTDAGSITIAARAQTDSVEILVSDTGTGISQEDQAKLFGKFQQISSVQAGRPAGTGLGLYISREIIRKMGGELWIQSSTVGEGTTFAFTLPCSGTSHARRIKQARSAEETLHPDAV